MEDVAAVREWCAVSAKAPFSGSSGALHLSGRGSFCAAPSCRVWRWLCPQPIDPLQDLCEQPIDAHALAARLSPGQHGHQFGANWECRFIHEFPILWISMRDDPRSASRRDPVGTRKLPDSALRKRGEPGSLLNVERRHSSAPIHTWLFGRSPTLSKSTQSIVVRWADDPARRRRVG